MLSQTKVFWEQDYDMEDLWCVRIKQRSRSYTTKRYKYKKVLCHEFTLAGVVQPRAEAPLLCVPRAVRMQVPRNWYENYHFTSVHRVGQMFSWSHENSFPTRNSPDKEKPNPPDSWLQYLLRTTPFTWLFQANLLLMVSHRDDQNIHLQFPGSMNWYEICAVATPMKSTT